MNPNINIKKPLLILTMIIFLTAILLPYTSRYPDGLMKIANDFATIKTKVLIFPTEINLNFLQNGFKKIPILIHLICSILIVFSVSYGIGVYIRYKSRKI